MRAWLLLLVAIPTSLQAQNDIQYSVSNFLRYGSGEEQGALARHRDYFENLTETRITISDFLVGFRLLHDAPPEFGVEFSGLKKRYLEFRRDDVYVRAGNSFTLYGRGLALNLFENRTLGLDTGLDGVKMEYKTRMIKLGFTAGDIHYLDVVALSSQSNPMTRVEDYRIRAGSVEVIPYPFASLGVNFVSGKTPPPAFPLFPTMQFSQFDIPEFFGKLSVGGMDMYASYAEKRTTVYGDTLGAHLGTAFYGSASYTEESFGVSVEYKDYRFGIADKQERNDSQRAKRAFAFQNPPAVHKEHSFTLLSRYPHVPDFSDEVGFQVDVFYTVLQQLTGNLNFSAASRHYSFDSVGVTMLPGNIPYAKYGAPGRKMSFLPSFAAKYSPFWEAYVEFMYYLEEDGTDYALIGFDRRSEDFADERHTPAAPIGVINSRRTTAIPVSIQYTLNGDWVLKFTSERQWVFDDEEEAKAKRFYNHLFSIGIAKSPSYAVTFRYEFTSDRETNDGRRNWTAIDATYKFSNNHTVTLTIGGNRGGKMCANGFCREVNPFLGFRASILSYL